MFVTMTNDLAEFPNAVAERFSVRTIEQAIVEAGKRALRKQPGEVFYVESVHPMRKLRTEKVVVEIDVAQFDGADGMYLDMLIRNHAITVAFEKLGLDTNHLDRHRVDVTLRGVSDTTYNRDKLVAAKVTFHTKFGTFASLDDAVDSIIEHGDSDSVRVSFNGMPYANSLLVQPAFGTYEATVSVDMYVEEVASYIVFGG